MPRRDLARRLERLERAQRAQRPRPPCPECGDAAYAVLGVDGARPAWYEPGLGCRACGPRPLKVYIGWDPADAAKPAPGEPPDSA